MAHCILALDFTLAMAICTQHSLNKPSSYAVHRFWFFLFFKILERITQHTFISLIFFYWHANDWIIIRPMYYNTSNISRWSRHQPKPFSNNIAICSIKYYYSIPCFACCSSCQICKGEGGGEDLWRPNAIFLPTLWECALVQYTILRKAQTKWNIQLWGTNVKQKPFGSRHFHQRALLLCCFVFNANRR